MECDQATLAADAIVELKRITSLTYRQKQLIANNELMVIANEVGRRRRFAGIEFFFVVAGLIFWTLLGLRAAEWQVMPAAGVVVATIMYLRRSEVTDKVGPIARKFELGRGGGLAPSRLLNELCLWQDLNIHQRTRLYSFQLVAVTREIIRTRLLAAYGLLFTVWIVFAAGLYHECLEIQSVVTLHQRIYVFVAPIFFIGVAVVGTVLGLREKSIAKNLSSLIGTYSFLDAAADYAFLQAVNSDGKFNYVRRRSYRRFAVS